MGRRWAMWFLCSAGLISSCSVRGGSFTGAGGIQWVLIAGGTFDDGQVSEKPAHTVTLADFYLPKHEVTVSQFRQFSHSTRSVVWI